MWLRELAESKSGDGFEVAVVAGGEVHAVFQCGGCDECVGESYAGVAADSPCAFGDCAVDGQLAERRQELADRVGSGGAGEQLGPCDHGVGQPVLAGDEWLGAAEVVNEDVGVDQDVSHGPTRHD